MLDICSCSKSARSQAVSLMVMFLLFFMVFLISGFIGGFRLGMIVILAALMLGALGSALYLIRSYDHTLMTVNGLTCLSLSGNTHYYWNEVRFAERYSVNHAFGKVEGIIVSVGAEEKDLRYFSLLTGKAGSKEKYVLLPYSVEAMNGLKKYVGDELISTGEIKTDDLKK